MKHLIITLGDPYGIGPEVTFKALKKAGKINAEITVIGDIAAFKTFGTLKQKINYIDIKSRYGAPQKAEPSKRGGDISFKALNTAVNLALKTKNSALVTAPISKEAWQKAGVNYMGHTEFLREKAALDGALMMFKSGALICGLVTEHYALKDLSKAITKRRIKTAAKLLAATLPKGALIEVSALNPHERRT